MPLFLQRLTGIHPQEVRTIQWSLLYVISLFLSYYVLRPIRDEIGAAGGTKDLPWLFTATLIAMLIISPLFALMVRKLPRKKFIAFSYHFFAANLIAFSFFMHFAGEHWQLWIGRAFFIWVSVFNLFVVSVFWSLIVDIFNSEQGKRLFGILAAGATIGGILGSSVVSLLIATLGRSWLIVVAIVFLELAVLASSKVSVVSDDLNVHRYSAYAWKPVGGGVFSGLVHTLRSPYLAGIALFVLCYSMTSTFLYFQQADIAHLAFPERGVRTKFFANIDLLVNSLTLLFQVLITGRIIAAVGVTTTLCMLPMVSVAGFAALAFNPTVAVLVSVQVIRRVANFALARPAREILFTSCSREDRYKTKNFIDTVIYRGGDQVASWSYAGLMGLGLALGQVAWVAIPLSMIWLALSGWLGRMHLRQELQSAPHPDDRHAVSELP